MYLIDTNVLSVGAPTSAVAIPAPVDWMDRNGARVPPIDLETARNIGARSDLARSQGQAPGLADLAIAATAQTHGYTVLTRHLRHFGPLGVLAIDPYEGLPVSRL